MAPPGPRMEAVDIKGRPVSGSAILRSDRAHFTSPRPFADRLAAGHVEPREVAKTVLARPGRACRRLSPLRRASLPTGGGHPLPPDKARKVGRGTRPTALLCGGAVGLVPRPTLRPNG